MQHLKKIIHIADIHIRLFKRHQEYRQVFKKFYEMLDQRDLSDTAIVIAGDVIHTKTDMSPELVHIVFEFLKELTSRTDVILIAGNHDVSKHNSQRLDALSPIVENLNSDRLHFYKESGIYPFANVEFGVFSIMGSINDYPTIEKLSSNKKKIALCHAPLNNAKTATGHVLSSNLSVNSFVGYDMVLLGDIHAQQVLQEKYPCVAYPGSFIQSNYGESLNGHGFLVWDVDTAEIIESVDVPNEYGYCTLHVNSTALPDTSHFPKNVRLRLIVEDVENSDIKKILAVLKKRHNILEVTIDKKSAISLSSTDTRAIKGIIDNIHDISCQNNLIKDYIEASVTDETLDKIYEINSNLNKRIGVDELPKNIYWRPLCLKFDNLFSYGENNIMNFEDMNGLYGLFAPNASGKTAALDVLCFVLYDKTPRAYKGNHIMNTRKDTFFASLELEIGNSRYVIERSGTRKKTGDVKVDVNFFRQENDGTTTSLNAEDRRSTNNQIRSYVGTYEDFIFTTFSVQGHDSLFIDSGQSDRKDLLSQFIGLTIFDKLSDIASNDIKELTGKIKVFRSKDFTQQLVNVQKDIEQHENDFSLVEMELQEKNKSIKEVQDKILKKTINKPEVDSTLTNLNISEINNKIISLSEKHKTSLLNIIERENNISEFAKRLSEFENERTKYRSISELENDVEKYNSKNKQYTTINNKLLILKNDAKNKQEKLEKLREHKYDPECEYCINNIFVKDAIATEQSYNKLVSLIENANKELEIIQNEVDLLRESIEEFNTVDQLEKNIIKYKTEITQFELQKEKISTLILNLQNEKDKYISLKKKYEDNVASIQLLTVFNKEMNALQTEMQNHETLRQNIEIKHNNILSKLSISRNKRDEMISLIQEMKELESEYEAYEAYLQITGRDGLPYRIISSIIPELQIRINDILTQVVDFSIVLEMDGKNINGKIVYDDERSWSLELASGMERFIAGLAIRVALISVSNLPKANFLIIDEGFSALDSDNIHNIQKLFDMLKAQFDFLIIISHLDIMRDVVENILEIRRDDSYSYIRI